MLIIADPSAGKKKFSQKVTNPAISKSN